jgi:putative resolvase
VGTRQPHPSKPAYGWWRQGTLPGAGAAGVGPHDPDPQTPSAGGGWVGLYAWISSHDHRADLDRQVARLSQWAATAGWTVIGVEAEVASGMNGKRPKLRRLLADPSVAAVVEHRDRLARINAELVEAGRRPVVLEEGEVDLVGDVVEVLTWLCARLYGHRSARNRALKASRCARYDGGSAGVIAGVAAAGRHGEAVG